jgi:uncharacterized protein (TIGR02147 family)
MDIYEYTDYRKFMRDFYEAEKVRNPHFSHRYIALKVGFSSSGFFAKILQGRTNISSELALKFAEFMKLKKREAEYFDLLVQFDQAKSQAEKNMRFEKILSYRRSKVTIVDEYQYEYYRKWYYLALREVLAFYPFDGRDYRALGKVLDPSITAAQARKGVELLERLGFIHKNEKGVYVQKDAVISTGYAAPPMIVNNFLLASMDRAKEAIDRFPRSERDVSALVMHFSRDLFPTINEKLKTFRRELLELVRNDPKQADQAYQFNFQMYPLSRQFRGHAR